MVVMHQVLGLFVAWRAVLNLNRRVSDPEIGAEPFLNRAHDALRIGQRLVANHDVTTAGHVLG